MKHGYDHFPSLSVIVKPYMEENVICERVKLFLELFGSIESTCKFVQSQSKTCLKCLCVTRRG